MQQADLVSKSISGEFWIVLLNLFAQDTWFVPLIITDIENKDQSVYKFDSKI